MDDFRLILESVPERYLILRPDFSIAAVSDAYLDATMTRRQDILGKNIFVVFPENPDAPTGGMSKLRDSLHTVLRERRADTMLVTKYDIPRPESQGGGFEERYWSPINAPVFNAAGDIIYIVHRVEDITDYVKLKQKGHRMEEELFVRAREVEEANAQLREANEELARRNKERARLLERLRELDKLKSAFFANVSHEFRTPITLLIGVLQDAMERGITLGPADCKMLMRSARRLLKLVNTLLDFSRIEAGRAEVSFVATELAGFTAEIASTFRSMIERAGIEYVVDCPPLPRPVFVDRDAYEKIVLNLISNAFKYTFRGRIEVSMAAREHGVELRVKDTGVGIPKKDQPLIFERFHRVQGTRGRTHEGSGIGLALVDQLVKMHGGTISVASELDRGSVFTLTLRYGTEHLAQEQINRAEPEPRTTARTASAYVDEAAQWLDDGSKDAPPVRVALSGKAEGLRILVVDDNADMRDYIARLLEQIWVVDSAPDGRAALARIRDTPPDAVITDVMMPHMDGFELIAALRADPQTADIPVLVLSARAGEESRLAGLQCGADEYLAKPFSGRELLTRVQALLDKRRQERELALANRRKDEFLAMLGHELRNPLAPLNTALALLEPRIGKDREAARYLAVISRQVVALSRIVDDLLDVARVTQGKIALVKESLDLREVLRRATEDVDMFVAEQRHELSLTLPEHPVAVFGDHVRLEQVFINLLINAIKYTEPGGRIRVHMEPMGDQVEVRISDTGIGMSESVLAHIFELFEQGPCNHRGHQSGLGVGLTVVQTLVDLHGGAIKAHSAGPGHGSEFVVRLPRISDDDIAAPDDAQDPAGTSAQPCLRVLIVDDNIDAADLLAMWMSAQGHTCEIAHRGAQAIEIAGTWSPDLIFLDIGLPDVDGYEVAAAIRAKDIPEPAIVLLTGYGLKAVPRAAGGGEFLRHLVKPAKLSDIEEVLQEVATRAAER